MPSITRLTVVHSDAARAGSVLLSAATISPPTMADIPTANINVAQIRPNTVAERARTGAWA
jgi:hypothetical protein